MLKLLLIKLLLKDKTEKCSKLIILSVTLDTHSVQLQYREKIDWRLLDTMNTIDSSSTDIQH